MARDNVRFNMMWVAPKNCAHFTATNTGDRFVPKIQRFFLDGFNFITRKALTLKREPERQATRSSNNTL